MSDIFKLAIVVLLLAVMALYPYFKPMFYIIMRSLTGSEKWKT
ncbi:hypothetical protein ACFLY1_00225 [Patescibacteria group bacterium]